MLTYERDDVSEIINRFKFKLGFSFPCQSNSLVCASRKLECLEILIYCWGGKPKPWHVYEGQRKPFRRVFSFCCPETGRGSALSDHHNTLGGFQIKNIQIPLCILQVSACTSSINMAKLVTKMTSSPENMCLKIKLKSIIYSLIL